MTFARRLKSVAARGGGTPGGGLLLALVLAVFISVTVQSVLTAVVAQHAMLGAAAADAAQHAQVLGGTGTTSPLSSPEATRRWLDQLVAAPEIIAARVLDADGLVLAAAGGARGADTSWWDAQDGWSAGRTSDAVSRRVGGTVHVTTPVDPASADAVALQLVLDGDTVAERSVSLQRRLVVLLVLGGATTVVLWLLLTGRGRGRRRDTADELTGLAGRQALAADLERGLADRHPALAVALVDLNGVSEVRDERGRRAADALLRTVAALVRGGGHSAYRVAGDGFALLLPGMSAGTARELAEGVADRVAREAAPLSADIGVAGLDADVPGDAESLVIRAEEDLADARERRTSAARRAADDVPVPRAGDEGAADEPAYDDPWDIRWITERP